MNEVAYFKGESQLKKERKLYVFILIISIACIFYSVLKNDMILLVVYTLFFLFGVYIIIKNFKKTPSLIVNKKGIKSNLNNMGIVEWKHINDFSINSNHKNKFLVLNLKENDEYLKSVSAFSRALMKTNIGKFGSPVIFPSVLFSKPIEDIKEELENYKNSL
ncbi:STM3941 family protein [Aureivirga sp. CE67]|uniref:STM3941 family protein n=1 Tax=Aureivirga sp. CE67 TaxID=1788983 RepID=UPI0018CA19FC|nr:STM3941 family protein [Aureivirga sp. CE67]